MTKVIGFAGKMASGKDYTAELVMNQLREKSVVYHTTYAKALREELDQIIGMIKAGVSDQVIADEMTITTKQAAKVRSICESDPNWNQLFYSSKGRTDNVRQLLQYFGTDVRRAQNPNYWVDKVKEEIELAIEFSADYVFVTDVRFPNEADLIKKDFKGKLIKCVAAEELRQERIAERNVKVNQSELTHRSENSLETYEGFHLIVDTGSTNEVDKFASMIQIFSTIE